jgi:hypothetical protein
MSIRRALSFFVAVLGSRPGEFRSEPLAEPDVNLSIHPAPIKRTRRSYIERFVCRMHRGHPVSSCFATDTLLRWHHKLIAEKYDGSAKRGPGRSTKAADLAALIVWKETGNGKYFGGASQILKPP